MQIERNGVCRVLLWILLVAVLTVPAVGEEPELCQKFGPQSPRDISNPDGTNPVVFSVEPPVEKMTLCNVHFHMNAEHKGPGYSQFVGSGKFGGFACDGSGEPAGPSICGNVKPGSTVEFHWVYTTCDVDVEPGEGLDACSSASCANPQLRVEAQVFRVVDREGEDLAEYAMAPPGEGIVRYLGSTTGPDYSAEVCSPLQVSWSVRPGCRSVSFESLDAWCEHNAFDEDHAHGARRLVTELPLLSKIGG